MWKNECDSFQIIRFISDENITSTIGLIHWNSYSICFEKPSRVSIYYDSSGWRWSTPVIFSKRGVTREGRMGKRRPHTGARREFEIRKEEWCIKICRKNVKTLVEMEEGRRGSNLGTIPQIYRLAFLSRTEISRKIYRKCIRRQSILFFHLLASLF